MQSLPLANPNQKVAEYASATSNNLLLTRGFSKVLANEEILNETRDQIELTLKRNKAKNSTTTYIDDLTVYSFMLPDLTQYTDEFREFLQNDLIEVSASGSLTEAGHLNWWANDAWEGTCRLLFPMCTSGDGNCLLHAVSLAMWGLHDRYLVLRKALHSTLEDIKPDSALWRRWKYEQMLQNQKYGLIYNDDEWDKEWSALLKLSSYQPRNSSNQSTLKETKPNDPNNENYRDSAPQNKTDGSK
jgi:OTU domain-containing protein 7